MNSSGIKRGLAGSAIAALAIAGLPMAASAQTVGQGEPAFELYSQYSGGASTRNDGTDKTVTLFAGTPATIGGKTVNSVRYSYSTDAGATWTNIGNLVVPIDGIATIQWTPPAQPPVVTNIRAEALDNVNDVLATQSQAVVVKTDAPAVKLDGALRSEVGQWQNEMVVTGRTSAAAGAPNLSVSARGPVSSNAAGPAPSLGDPDANNTRSFKTHVDISGNLTADPIDEVIVGATATDLLGSSDDVTAYKVYDQVVTGITAPLAAGSTEQVPAGSGEETKYVITAVDQKGAAIQGLDVFEADKAGAPAAGPSTPDGTTETNDDGKVTVTFDEANIAAGSSSQTGYYVVDVNENGTYEPGTDTLLTLSQSNYSVTPTKVEISSDLGTAVDDDETATLTFTVTDQKGKPVQGATVLWSDKRTNVDNNDKVDYPTDNPAITGLQYENAGTTNAQGKVSVTLPNRNDVNETHDVDAYVNLNGTPAPDQGDVIAAPVQVKSGLADITWDNGRKAQAGNATTTVQSGKLALAKFGDALGKRSVGVEITDLGDTTAGNDTGNAVLAPQSAQPEGTTRGSDLKANVLTRADGTFGVAVQDPASPNGEELDVEVTAQAPTLESPGDQTDATLSIDFLRSLTPTRVEIQDDLGTVDQVEAPFGDLEPGKYGYGTVVAYNADGVALTDLVVPVTIKEGSFIDLDNPFDPEPKVGEQAGEWSSAGKSISVTTDDDGEGFFAFNIERNEGFDDDGRVSDKINAGTGAASFEFDFTWDTIGTPLNPGATPLVVTLSDTQESSILPQARVGQEVAYDVETYDQFGNRTQQNLTVRDDTPRAGTQGSSSEFDLNQPAIIAEATSATSQSLEVELDNATKFLYVDNKSNSQFDPTNPAANFASFSSADIQETTDAIEWYTVDEAASSFSLMQEGDETVPVGTTVTMVANAVDQNGQPLYGNDVQVKWVRSGPGGQDSDGQGMADPTTDMNGNAYYDFAGTSEGTAEVTAIITVGGQRVARLVDTVTFGKNPGGGDPVEVEALISGDSNGGAKDVVRFQVDDAAEGATVKLFKIRGKKSEGNKRLVQVREDIVPEGGTLTFKVADRNGNKKTRFVAKVGKTVNSLAAKSNTQKLR
ncbi:hypothetical protein BKA08_002181 [Nocardioides marinisabuli]|uniref:Big-1 domain-containing protein n=1 Tax=Nocardioides marinisabuli TaxID=419476 RepID=A0A7Y9F1J8_9ACTN|nr:Ig-like domain-containing protein [Nocardioides marinisabuli]NYD57943.1 hypothetical protein [Nocardioides marinisabuli]